MKALGRPGWLAGGGLPEVKNDPKIARNLINPMENLDFKRGQFGGDED